ncbi:MAG: glutathione S-transferase family protein [Alphaproteobacteria bacterium]|nr:glutathione S-transferase family protein [Alphaproteobacteria bacterium]
MVLLVHHTLSPQSRKARIILAEKKVLFVLRQEEPWNMSADLKKLNPAGDLPVFIFDGNIISGNYAVTEYLEENYPEPKLLTGDFKHRAEIRRLCDWFDRKFYTEVYQYIIGEKVFKRFKSGLSPDSKILKAGMNNLKFHMEYIDWLAERNNYLAGSEISLADITAAAHLSILDYLGDIDWERYKNAKLWYSTIKSRPSFKEILKDTVKGIYPSQNYQNLDF